MAKKYKKEVLIYDKKRKQTIKFVWTNMKKYRTSIKALKKAQRQKKIDILSIS